MSLDRKNFGLTFLIFIVACVAAVTLAIRNWPGQEPTFYTHKAHLARDVDPDGYFSKLMSELGEPDLTATPGDFVRLLVVKPTDVRGYRLTVGREPRLTFSQKCGTEVKTREIRVPDQEVSNFALSVERSGFWKIPASGQANTAGLSQTYWLLEARVGKRGYHAVCQLGTGSAELNGLCEKIIHLAGEDG